MGDNADSAGLRALALYMAGPAVQIIDSAMRQSARQTRASRTAPTAVPPGDSVGSRQLVSGGVVLLLRKDCESLSTTLLKIAKPMLPELGRLKPSSRSCAFSMAETRNRVSKYARNRAPEVVARTFSGELDRG